MQTATIGLIAAMPEETRPLLAAIGEFREERAGRYAIYRFTIGDRQVCLLESGMGPRNAAEGASRLIETSKPRLILNFGFAGSLSPELKVGEIVSAERLLFFHDGLFSEQQWLTSLQQPLAHQTTFVTTSRITDKKYLAARLPSSISRAVVEMETTAMAKVAGAAGIPFMAIRAITDTLDEELAFTLDEFCDQELNLKLWRVLLTVVRKPRIIPQLARLSGNSRRAGKILAETVMRVVPTLDIGYPLQPPATECGKSRRCSASSSLE